MRTIDTIINHWSNSGPNTTVDMIRDWHVRGNGWADIGYHRIILYPQGHEKYWWELVKLGRPVENVGAHTLGHNTGSFGICTVGKPGLDLHPLQIVAIIKTNKVIQKRYNIHSTKIKCHRDFNATQCPGDQIEGIIRGL